MKSFFTKLLPSAVLATMLFGAATAWAAEHPSVTCHNGTFIGTTEQETDVLTFKGIPFAKPPMGDLRWKAPVEAPESSATFEAKTFGEHPLQMELAAGLDESTVGEDCLKLNVWTKNLSGKGKPVMVYIHGGAYIGESAGMPIYSGQYIASAHPDIIVVSLEYRVGLMGFIDLTRVPGGEAYPDSRYLGLLDCLMGLKWVQRNIAAFGGDPNNVTIFGESAGGGMVSCLMSMPEAKGLFRRVIAQSGSFTLSFNEKNYEETGATEQLMRIIGAKDMKDLLAMDKKTYLNALKQETNLMGLTGHGILGGLMNFPLRGGNGPVPADMLGKTAIDASKDVDFMVGTVGDEWRYWIALFGQPTHKGNIEKYAAMMEDKTVAIRQKVGPELAGRIDAVVREAKPEQDQWSKLYPNIWKQTELFNELNFRMPSIRHAEAHAQSGGTGKTYMYYFDRRASQYKWTGAEHAVELPFVFNNPHGLNSEADKKLASKVVQMWTNFARTGNPSTADVAWRPYDTDKRATMIIDNNGKTYMRNDFKGSQRKLLEPLDPYAF